MNQRDRDILESCPFGLSRLTSLDGDTLEYVTGKELIGMLLLAKQHGPFSKFNVVWSLCPVTNVVPKEDVSAETDCCFKHPTMELRNFLDRLVEINADKAQTPTRIPHRSEINSPFTDPSPSPPPRMTHERFLGNKTRYSYYRLIFAGFKLPILLVGYFEPEAQ